MKVKADIAKNDRNILWTLTAILAIAIVLSWFANQPFFLIAVLFVLLYLIARILVKTVRTINLDGYGQVLHIEFQNRLSMKSSRNFSFSDISYSYKRVEFSRMHYGKRLRIYRHNRCVLKLDEIEYGWEEEQVDAVVRGLDIYGIPKKRERNALMDVFPGDE